MISENVFHVLACVDLSAEAGRRKLSGIYRFLSGGHAWSLSLMRSQKEFDERFEKAIAKTHFDGFLVAVPEDDRMRLRHKELRTPTAFIDYVDRRLLGTFENCVFIHDDDRDIGRCAARHLAAQGSIAGYGYAESNDERPWNKRRGDAFAEALRRHGAKVSRLKNADDRSPAEIADWIRTLPSPVAILAAYDDTARHILESCRIAKLCVPAEVSVLGIGNDDLICPYTSPALSSVIPDFEKEGFEAARELHGMMISRHPSARREILCGCSGISQRGSTTGENPSALMIQESLSYIRENAFRGISAADVVSRMHVSRRLADLRFREATGTSILAYLTDLRLTRVRHLLDTTDLCISEIASQCGYDAAVLKNLFSRHVGCSMRAYRARTGNRLSAR